MTEEAKKTKKETGPSLAQVVLALQEMAHFTGQERVLDKYGIPRMDNAHQTGYKKR
jgi:hypothetical protein